jgi:hypothetical protein
MSNISVNLARLLAGVSRDQVLRMQPAERAALVREYDRIMARMRRAAPRRKRFLKARGAPSPEVIFEDLYARRAREMRRRKPLPRSPPSSSRAG